MALVKRRSTLKVWGDVIFAIFLREIKSKFNDKFGIAWAVISPITFIFMLSFMREKMSGGGLSHGMPVIMFMLIGMTFVQFFLGVVGSTSNAIQKNRPLYAFRQVQPISSVIAISGFEFLIKLVVVITMAMLLFIFQYNLQVDEVLEVILNLTKIWLIASSLGIVFSLATSFIPEMKKVIDIAMRPMFFISGIFFSLQDIPQAYWPYLTWNPLLHAVELTRYAAYPEYGTAGVSDLYLDMTTIICVFFALACYQISWKQAISR
jgi:capsular polysaccharide transport system permease protein